MRTSFIIYDRKTDAPIMSWPARSEDVRDLATAALAALSHAEDVNAAMGCDVCYVRPVTIKL